mgnify:CR=1 FL=1
MAWYTTEETLYFYETRRGLEPAETELTRWVDPTPFIPHNAQKRAERCELILKMQADGLAKRLEHAHAKTGG